MNRAVEMAAAAKNDQYENQVAAGVLEAEKTLIDKGISPKDAERFQLSGCSGVRMVVTELEYRGWLMPETAGKMSRKLHPPT